MFIINFSDDNYSVERNFSNNIISVNEEIIVSLLVKPGPDTSIFVIEENLSKDFVLINSSDSDYVGEKKLNGLK